MRTTFSIKLPVNAILNYVYELKEEKGMEKITNRGRNKDVNWTIGLLNHRDHGSKTGFYIIFWYFIPHGNLSYPIYVLR